MNCMNCGKPTRGDAVLCRACAAEERRRTRVAEHPAVNLSKRPAPRRLTAVLIAALCVTTAAVVGLSIYLAASANRRSVATARLRVQQEELDRREYQLAQSEDETTALTEQLAQLQADNDDLRQQLRTLDSQLGAADSERNQATSNYIQQVADLEQQLRQLESAQKTMEEDLNTLQEANKALTEDKDALQGQIDTLTEERDNLVYELDDLQDRYDLLVANYRGNDGGSGTNTTQYLNYKKKADFLDSYIVFVQDDSTGYYHTYDWANFTSTTFWAYNRSLAKSQGYTPCPVCGGGG